MKRTLIKTALIFLGSLSLINVIISAFLVTSIHLGYFLQAAVSAVFIIYGVFIDKISIKIHILATTVCLLAAVFIIFLAAYGKTSNVDYTEDAVIVLGAGLRGDNEVSPHLAWRLISAVDYFKENPDALIIVCGGLGAGRVITEAEAMERFLVANGIPLESIIREDKSTSTYENLAFAKEILTGYFPDGFRAVLITSDFHVFRAVQVADSLEITVNRRGAKTPWATLPLNYLREMTAVLHMWFL